jgi:probable phosphoglycerate mutase
MRLHFLRHAHAVTQRDPLTVAGRSARAPLTPEGSRQAEAFARVARRLGVTAIYASTCLRALQTAAPAARALGLRVIPEPRLAERSHGLLEGRAKRDAYTPDLVARIHADQYRWVPPGGESLEDVARRLRSLLTALAREPHEAVLLVTHTMALWALFGACTGCDHRILPRLRVDNAGLVEAALDGAALRDGAPLLEAVRILRWNQHPA